MYEFIITLEKDKISVCEFKKGKFEKLKNNGEFWQKFDDESFWVWFRKKTEIKENSHCAFVILTDKSDFLIPEDINIKDSFELTNENVKDFFKGGVPEKLKLISYPDGFSDNIYEPKKQDIEVLSDKECDDLVSYFKIKTKEYESR